MNTPATIRAEKAARSQSRWALRSRPAPVFADAFGVDASRIRHQRTDDPNGPVERTCLAIMTAEDDEAATAILTSVLAAYEHRPLLDADPSILISRWHYLWYREHELDAAEDQAAALYLGGAEGEAYDDALRTHGAVQLEMAEIRAELEWRGVDTRGCLR